MKFSWRFEIAPAGLGFVNSENLESEDAGDLIMGAAVPNLLAGQLWRLELNEPRTTSNQHQ